MVAAVWAFGYCGNLIAQAPRSPISDTLPAVYQLSGIVMETAEGLPVAFTRIVVKGQRRGCFSNETGYYSLPVGPQDTLQISRIGYKAQEVAIRDVVKGNGNPSNPFIYNVIFLTEDPLSTPTVPIYAYGSAHDLKLAFRNIPIPTNNPVEMARDNLRPGAIASYVEGLPVDPTDELAIAQQQYLAHYATRRALPYLPVVDPVAIVKFIQYIGQRNEAQRQQIYNYWPN
jgi:hypothetical protein